MQAQNFTYTTTGALEKTAVFFMTGSEKKESPQKIGLDYFPYGKLLRSFQGGSGHERYLTTQHERDHETISENNDGTGYTNAGARLYDSDVARWLTLDPMAADLPSWSAYNYVLGNPVAFIDPDGKAAMFFDGGKKLGPNQDAGVESTGSHTGNTVNNTTTTRGNTSISVTNTTSGQYGGTNSTTSTISGSSRNIGNVSNKSAEVLATSMRASNTPQVKVTSTQRTPEQQASAMYNNALNKGAQSQYRLYSSNGDKVIRTFENYTPAWCCSKSEAVSAMAATIRNVGPSNVSRHAADPTKLNVIDMSTISLGSGARGFHNALNNNSDVSKLLTPFNSTDPAFHVEIP